MDKLRNIIIWVLFLLMFVADFTRAYGVGTTEPRTVYISTSDNQWPLWLPMDSQKAIETAFDMLHKDYGVNRVFWRGGQAELWKNTCIFRDQNRLIAEYWKWIHQLIDEGNNKDAFAAANKNNMSMWLVYGLFEFLGPAEANNSSPFPIQHKATIEHPEWMPINKYGTRKQPGPICLGYPEAREYFVKMLKDFVIEKGYEGIAFYTYSENNSLRYVDEFGYNEPIIKDFKARYGVDILTEPFDKNLLAELRGEYVTKFLRELKQALAPNGVKVCVWLNYEDPCKPMYWGLVKPLTPTAGHIFMDWKRWVDEALVDELTVYWPGNSKVIEQVNTYCQGSQTNVSAMVTYGNLPNGVGRVLQGGTESGYGYENKINWPDENFPVEPLESLSDVDTYAKRRTLYSIMKGKIEAELPDVIPAVFDEDIYVRRMALRTLAELGDIRAIPVIESALQDSENSVRCQAAVSLAKIGDSESLKRIIHTIGSHGTFQFNIEAVKESLVEMDKRNALDANCLSILNDALKSDNHDIRRSVLFGIKSLKCSKYPPLFSLLSEAVKNDRDSFCRELAIEAIAKCEPETAVIDVLLEKLDDEDEVVQVRAATFVSQRSVASAVSNDLKNRVLNNLIELFKNYGTNSMRSDKEWGWRDVGNAILLFGELGENELNKILQNSNDRKLSKLSWQTLYLRQKQGKYIFSDERQDERDHKFYPNPDAASIE